MISVYFVQLINVQKTVAINHDTVFDSLRSMDQTPIQMRPYFEKSPHQSLTLLRMGRIISTVQESCHGAGPALLMWDALPRLNGNKFARKGILKISSSNRFVAHLLSFQPKGNYCKLQPPLSSLIPISTLLCRSRSIRSGPRSQVHSHSKIDPGKAPRLSSYYTAS